MKFSNPDNDPKGEWFSSNAASPNQKSNNNRFKIMLPNGTYCERDWKFSKDDFENGKIDLYFKGNNVPRLKVYKDKYNQNSSIQSTIIEKLGSLTSAKTTIKNIFNIDFDLFDTPKPVELIKHLLKLTTDKSSIILDFFAGSGTTAHAVMDLNKEDNGNRKFILVQLDEVVKNEKTQ